MKQMKHLLILLALMIGLTACSADTQRKEDAPKEGVEVLYFHGKQRCATCQAIEKETKALIDSQFADEVKSGKLRFRIVDITKAENESLADKYEITWSSLVIVKYNNGKVIDEVASHQKSTICEETAENLTQFAFANARSNPAQFKKELTAKINQMLK